MKSCRILFAVVVSTLFWTALLGGPGAARAQAPPVGSSAALALLRHGHATCDEIRQRLLARWNSIGRGSEGLQEWIFHNATAEVAEARAAVDLARRALPSARREQGAAAAEILEKLYELEIRFCNLVAQPPTPRASFETEVESLTRERDAAQAALGRLWVVADEEMKAALEPHLAELREAGRAAERERRQYLDRNKPPPPPPPTLTDHMVVWHRGYAALARPCKEALGAYVQARRNSDTRGLAPSCRTLLREALVVLDRPIALKAPDPRVETPLRSAFVEMQRLAGQCTAGRFDKVEEHFARMEKHLGEAAAVLRLYGLQP